MAGGGAPVGITCSAFMLAMQRLSTSARDARSAPACDLPVTKQPSNVVYVANAVLSCCPPSLTNAAALKTPLTKPRLQDRIWHDIVDCRQCP